MTSLNNLPDTSRNHCTEVSDVLTKDMLTGALPDKRFKKYVTDELVDIVNAEPNSELRRVFRDNTITFSSVLSTGRYSLAAYVNAVKFCSLKLIGDTSTVAYSKVFPDRYKSLVDRGTSTSQIASYSDNYAKKPIIVKIMEQTLIPTHILNAGIYQEAINSQAELMRYAKSEMVRQKAGESLINHLKSPESTKIELDISYGNDLIEELRSTTRALAQEQVKLIRSGNANAEDIAHSDIIAKRVETEYSEVKHVN